MASTITYRTGPNGQVSTDTYTAVPLTMPGYDAPIEEGRMVLDTSGPLTAWLRNSGANNIKCRITADNDKATPAAQRVIVATEVTVTASNGINSLTVDVAGYVNYYLEVAASAGGQQGTLDARLCQKRV